MEKKIQPKKEQKRTKMPSYGKFSLSPLIFPLESAILMYHNSAAVTKNNRVMVLHKRVGRVETDVGLPGFRFPSRRGSPRIAKKRPYFVR